MRRWCRWSTVRSCCWRCLTLGSSSPIGDDVAELERTRRCCAATCAAAAPRIGARPDAGTHSACFPAQGPKLRYGFRE